MASSNKVEVTLRDTLLSALLSLPNPKALLIAYSGGVDSHVLLHALVSVQQKLIKQFPDLTIKAIYIDHGLQDQSNQWAEHCAQQAELLCVSFEAVTVSISKGKGQSLEAVARKARYKALANQIKQGEYLLTAQHADDQIETVLLQWLRGAGPNGLAAMPRQSQFAEGFHLRPFLSITRDEILQYAQQYQLSWIEDPSNQSIEFDRNYLRQKVVPILKERWPSLAKTTQRSAQHCANAAASVNLIAKEEYQRIAAVDQKQLPIIKLAEFDAVQQSNILRYWLELNNAPCPNQKHIEQIVMHLIPHQGQMPCVAWAKIEIRRFNDCLFLLDSLPLQKFQEGIWHKQEDFMLGMGRKLIIKESVGKGIDAQKWQAATVKVAFRQGGEKIQQPNKVHHTTLKHLLQELNIPPWERARLPLIYLDGSLAAVVGVCIDQAFQAESNQAAYDIRLV